MKSLSQQRIRLLFEYREDGLLIWRVRPVEDFKTARACSITNSRQAGKPAGHVRSDGYRLIGVDGELYRAHRLVWLWHTGTDHAGDIDHVDHDRDNNRIENLRAVTHSENLKNRSVAGRESGAVIGVYWIASKGKWRADIKVCGKAIYLGIFSTQDEAIAARKAAELEHGFHPNHGRPSAHASRYHSTHNAADDDQFDYFMQQMLAGELP